MTSLGAGLVHGSGWLAAMLLAASLGASALGAHPRVSARARRARRALGLASAVAASGHAVLSWRGPLEVDAAASIIGLPWLRAGALALAILAVLFATSFGARHPRRPIPAWSALHRLVHVATGLVALHLLLGPTAPMRWTLGWLVAVAATYAIRWVRPWRRGSPPR